MQPLEFKRLLKQAELTQVEFANITGYSNRQMSRFVSGEHEVPAALQVLIRLFASLETIKRGKE